MNLNVLVILRKSTNSREFRAGTEYSLLFTKKNGLFRQKFRNDRFGFTLAEVLITLGIIGVVAAITMPVLIANHRKKLRL